MAVVTMAMMTIIAKTASVMTPRFTADVQDHQLDQPACVHEDADGAGFAPGKPAGAGRDRRAAELPQAGRQDDQRR